MALSNAQIGQENFVENSEILEPGPHETVTWDDVVTGLGLRRRGGKRTWILQWRVDGRSRKLTLGSADDIGVVAARALARDVLAKSDASDVPALSKSTTMAAFAEQFLKDCAGQWKASTLKTNRGFIMRTILPALGSRKVASIDADDVHGFYAGLDVAPDTGIRILSILSCMMNHAELRELRAPDSNPCRGMRKRKSDFMARYLNPAEFARLGQAFNRFETVYPDAVQMFRFVALTGCRIGEARGLKWAMIDGNRAALPDAKGGPSAIWLGGTVKRLLASRPRTHDLVFVTGDNPITTGTVNRSWKAIRLAADLPILRIHDLRHNFAKVAVTLDYDLRVVKDLLGHKDLVTTQGYAHLDVATIQKASARVGRHMDKINVQKENAKRPSPNPAKPPQAPKPSKPPKPICHYSRFVRSKRTMAAYCEAHGLALKDFHHGLIAWRGQKSGAA